MLQFYSILQKRNVVRQPQAKATMSGEKLLCVVSGYHMYRMVWDPYLDGGFSTKHKQSNPHDKYTTAVLPNDWKHPEIVGYRTSSIKCQT